LFHWSLALAFALCWYTAETQQMDLHLWSGYAILGLLAFRIYWGVVGASTARFATFIRGPAAIGAYVRTLGARDGGGGAAPVGHNPLGALSVAALLALLVVQTALGLFAVDVDGLNSGPLSNFVDFDTGRLAARLHHLAFNLLLALIALHLTAIAFYLLVKRDNLIGPMISGRKSAAGGAGDDARFAPLWRIAPGLLVAAALVALVMRGFKF
jgi:cytochrome b